MSLDQWLLALHVTGAFLFLGGAVTAGTLSFLALRSRFPSEIALYLGLARVTVPIVGIGSLLTLVLGLWLVDRFGYSYGELWVSASVVLWIAAVAAGGIGGNRDKENRLLAERLAAEGDAESTELGTRLRDPVTLALSWGSGLGLVVVLALMIWEAGRLMLAVVRPDSWNLPLFLHVLGAIVLVGAMASVTVLAWAGSRRPQRDLLSRATFRTMLVLALPSWLLMRVAGQWSYSKEGFTDENEPNWLGPGFIAGDLGLPVLLLATGFAWWWMRRPASGWQSRTVGALALLYLVALAFTWWVMTAKPGL